MSEYDKKEILIELEQEGTLLGSIKKLAKIIKKDHIFAEELWARGDYKSRLLAVLIMDKKELNADEIIRLAEGLESHTTKEKSQISDWLLANQFMKSKKITDLMLTWQDDKHSILRRLFWYYQARLRWMGKIPLDNADALISLAEEKLLVEPEEVQWAINFCLGQIGIYDVKYRKRCIAIGVNYGLYKDEKAPKGCTPNYLPEFIRIEVEKKNK